jgi:hypothetical protein
MLSQMPARQPRNETARPKDEQETLGLLGVGLDGDDGHQRLTRGVDFCLVGGSAETHERMTDLVLRMNEKLKRAGKRFQDLSSPEFEDLARESFE